MGKNTPTFSSLLIILLFVSAIKPCYAQTNDYGPLLTTHWSIDSTSSEWFLIDPTNAAPALLAMSQIFRYYEYPNIGEGILCYNLVGHGERCRDFSQFELNFAEMDDAGTNQAVLDLVLLMASCGKIQSTGMELETFQLTLPVHYGYSSEMRRVSNYEAEFTDILISELSLGRPVPAYWHDTYFIIDGFRAPDMFHFNFGRGGEMDGFFRINGINTFTDPTQSLFYLYLNFHPDLGLPVPQNLSVNSIGPDLMFNWNMSIPDSLAGVPVKYVFMRGDMIKIAESDQRPATISKELIGGSAKIRCMAVFEGRGASELSEEVIYSSDNTTVEIQSVNLRIIIQNTLGNINIYTNPTRGELELLERIEVDCRDLRGLELLPNLKELLITGDKVTSLPEGDYLKRLRRVIFANTHNLDLTVFNQMNELYQIYGLRSVLPFDVFDIRHNYKMSYLNLTSMNENLYQVNDLYGIDKYFPHLTKLLILRMHDMGPMLDDYLSYESYYDILPKIRANVDLYKMNFPSSYIPCYPSPERNINQPGVNRISWQADFYEENMSVYNVYVGLERNQLDLVSEGQTEKGYSSNFALNKDYYWRVEAVHNDTVYPSGVYHFSTFQSTPMPFIDDFDEYYYHADIASENFSWQIFKSQFTGTAIASPIDPQSGYYSMELVPRSDAGVLIGNRGDSLFSIEFWVKNDFGEFGAELLQEDPLSGNPVANTLIGFYGANIGLVQSSGGLSSILFVSNEWNKIQVDIHMNDGRAELFLNDAFATTWSWFTRKDGVQSQNPLKGIRFLNSANSGVGSSFVDGLRITGTYSTGQNLIPLNSAELIYRAESREIVIKGIHPEEISIVQVFDMSGRLLATYQNLSEDHIQLDSDLPYGILMVRVGFKDSSVLTKRIQIY